MTDKEWYKLVKVGADEGWKLVWEKVVEPESRSLRSAELMRRYSLDVGDLMGMLYDEMIGKGKINLYRGEGSFQGWLKKYVRGYVLNGEPNKHGEVAINESHDSPVDDKWVIRKDVWLTTHYCFHDLWQEDPCRAYVHLLKTRFMLSSDEVRDFLEISSSANVDQIFSRAVKFMREAWPRHDA